MGGNWHRNAVPIEWSVFKDYFTTQEYANDSLLTKFKVTLSGLVQKVSIRRDVISITVHIVDGGTGWVRSHRGPIAAIDPTPSTEILHDLTDPFTVAVATKSTRAVNPSSSLTSLSR